MLWLMDLSQDRSSLIKNIRLIQRSTRQPPWKFIGFMSLGKLMLIQEFVSQMVAVELCALTTCWAGSLCLVTDAIVNIGLFTHTCSD